MEFNPNNKIIKLCLQGMEMEGQREFEEAEKLFLKAWNEAENDFEKFLAAHYISRQQKTNSDKLLWLEKGLQFALKVNNPSVNSALPGLYLNIAKCYDELNDTENAKKYSQLSNYSKNNLSDNGPFYHGTKADLQLGDFLTPGFNSNYKLELTMNHIYFTALVNGAGLAAALAKGEGKQRVYLVEPTGSFENDPNVTDKKFPGNPTRSYRTEAALKIVGEVEDWLKQTPEEIKKWQEKLDKNKGEIIN
jgi:tetratricopeptide (TPR) repeat protein